jgi:Na+/proline symporter
MNLTTIDWIIMLVYFIFVLGIGFALKRHMKTSTDFFLSGRSIPAWITGLAFISANLGAQEVIGININLWWGFAMLAFGAVMLLFGRRGMSAHSKAPHSLEGQRVEEAERRAGLESERAHHS